MSAVRFSILGSCVTSDVFRFASDLGPLASYHARTSILSIMSPPLPLADDELDWSSDFARRAVQADFAKTLFDDLEAASPDYLIVDFVDDRFATALRSVVVRPRAGLRRVWRRPDEQASARERPS